MKKIIVILAVVLIAGAITFLYLTKSDRREATFYPMGGIPFTVVAYQRSSSDFEADMKAVKDKVEELEKVYSLYRNDSELVTFNRVAGAGTVEVSPDLALVLLSSKKWYEDSNGTFDVTITPIEKVWKEAAKRGALPTTAELMEAQSRVGSDRILHLEGNEFRFTRQGVEVDLGGIAKGAMADAVKDLLISRGVKDGIVNAGGNGIAFGERPFKFGIQDPTVEDKDEVIGTLDVTAKAVVTSGNYRRYVTIEGKQYSHIIDPKTGTPVGTLASVTVICPKAIDADALATALSVMGREKSIEWLNAHPEYSAVLVEGNKEIGFRVYVSKDLKPSLVLLPSFAKSVEEF